MVGIHSCAFGWQSDEKTKTETTEAVNELHRAAKSGDLESTKSALKQGADVNSANAYGATALTYACERGHLEIAKLLLEKGANANVKDSFYGATPMVWASSNGHDDIVALLLEYKSDGGDAALMSAVNGKNREQVEKILATDSVTDKGILKARTAAKRASLTEISKLLDKIEVKEVPKTESVTLDQKKLVVGKYKADAFELEILLEGEKVFVKAQDQKFEITPVTAIRYELNTVEINFKMADGKPTGVDWKAGGNTTKLKWVDPAAPAATAKSEGKTSKEPTAEFLPSSPESKAADLAISSNNWPSFRGNGARGVADGQNPPIAWKLEKDADKGTNVLWKVPVAGLAHSCPAIWEDKLFLTSAVGADEKPGLKIGNYGDVASVENEGEHSFVVSCYNKHNGKLYWKRTANKSEVLVKRHLKSTHANSTPATDGEYVVAFFGYAGLYCYTADGDLVWEKGLGKLDSGWFYDEGYQWGFGSSPIIYDGKVIVQCDIQKKSFIACYDLATGNQEWRVDRDEIPSWSTPTIHETERGPMLITCGTKFARGYNAINGEEIWRMSGHSEIVVPTPFVAHDLIFLTSGYRPIQPVYAVKLDATGDVSLSKNENSNQHVEWAAKRYGPYMPSAICYGDYLYTCANRGILTCYQATTGMQVYRERLKSGGKSYVGSPVAADGHLYLTAENGQTVVVKAGPKFEVVATNDVAENVLSTAAISEGIFYVRGQNHLIALKTEKK
ncbi:ankyrin repeat domain-containing protein [Vicingaceae bacterium]|nr:ankyrin repeat domain-containing protein [Vicingaceae bacterium]